MFQSYSPQQISRPQNPMLQAVHHPQSSQYWATNSQYPQLQLNQPQWQQTQYQVGPSQYQFNQSPNFQPTLGPNPVIQNVIPQRQLYPTETKIEYVPYERSILEYEQVRRQIQVPQTKTVTDYYAIQYDTQYIPQIYTDKIIEYVPVERLQQRVEYQTYETQTVVQQPQIIPSNTRTLPNTRSQSFVGQYPNNQPLSTSFVVPVTSAPRYLGNSYSG